jgi:hypothetical protein
MIDEAAGKVLGMAMAYGVSSLGLFLAYVSYRRRTAPGERVMTPLAWGVVAAVLLVLAGGVLIVARLAEAPAPPILAAPELAPVEPPALAAPEIPREVPPLEPRPPTTRERWPLLGMVLPALIFLIATWITVAMYLHFSRGGEKV